MCVHRHVRVLTAARVEDRGQLRCLRSPPTLLRTASLVFAAAHILPGPGASGNFPGSPSHLAMGTLGLQAPHPKLRLMCRGFELRCSCLPASAFLVSCLPAKECFSNSFVMFGVVLSLLQRSCQHLQEQHYNLMSRSTASAQGAGSLLSAAGVSPLLFKR